VTTSAFAFVSGSPTLIASLACFIPLGAQTHWPLCFGHRKLSPSITDASQMVNSLLGDGAVSAVFSMKLIDR